MDGDSFCGETACAAAAIGCGFWSQHRNTVIAESRQILLASHLKLLRHFGCSHLFATRTLCSLHGRHRVGFDPGALRRTYLTCRQCRMLNSGYSRNWILCKATALTALLRYRTTTAGISSRHHILPIHERYSTASLASTRELSGYLSLTAGAVKPNRLIAILDKLRSPYCFGYCTPAPKRVRTRVLSFACSSTKYVSSITGICGPYRSNPLEVTAGLGGTDSPAEYAPTRHVGHARLVFGNAPALCTE